MRRTAKFSLLVALVVLCCGSPLKANGLDPGLVRQEGRHIYSLQADLIAPASWKAKWIWLPGVSNKERNHYMLARKVFHLADAPNDRAVMYITADTHYKLWVNGEFITRGPARSNPHHQNYDVLDLSKDLKAGENLIAVLVHYHGVMKSYYTDPYPGLLVQLELGEGDNKEYIVSDTEWKVWREWAWDNRTEWVNVVNANNFSSAYDFNKARTGWQYPGYHDTYWQYGVYQFGQPAWPPKEPGYEPYALQRPWFSLVPRDMPPLEEYDRPVESIFQLSEAPQYGKYLFWGDRREYNALWHSMQDVHNPLVNSQVEGADQFFDGKGPLTIRNSWPQEKFTRQPIYHTRIVFDLGKIANGYPYLRVKAGQGAVIDLTYAPYLVDDTFIPALMVDNWSDRIVFSGNDDYWEGTELRTFRFVGVTFRGEQPFELKELGLRVEAYPFQPAGSISVAEEAFIAELWEAGEKTIRAITTDGFTDNYHENRQYVQTSFYASRGNYASFADPYLQRRYLLQHAQDQLPNGIMPMWAPWGVYDGNNQVPGIFEANHFWLLGLHDYFLFTGDTTTVKELLVSAERCANALLALQTENGLLHKPPHPYWIDWARLAQGDQNFILNALQMLSFQHYAQVLTWLGHHARAEKWNVEAGKIGERLQAFWREDRGLFADNLNSGVPDNNFSEHANALAIVAGISSEEQSVSILDKLKENHLNRSMEEAVLFNFWIAEALSSKGFVVEAIDLFRRKYGHMVADKDIGTLWEYANIHAENVGERSFDAEDAWSPRSWSASQAENAYPPYTLSKWVLGVYPVTPGMTEMQITTMTSPYNQVSGSVPIAGGKLVTVEKSGNELSVELPADISGRIPLKAIRKYNNIEINGRAFDVSELQKDILLEPGEYLIKWE